MYYITIKYILDIPSKMVLPILYKNYKLYCVLETGNRFTTDESAITSLQVRKHGGTLSLCQPKRTQAFQPSLWCLYCVGFHYTPWCQTPHIFMTSTAWRERNAATPTEEQLPFLPLYFFTLFFPSNCTKITSL